MFNFKEKFICKWERVGGGRERERDRLRNYRRIESMKRGKMKEKEREEGRKWGEKKI